MIKFFIAIDKYFLPFYNPIISAYRFSLFISVSLKGFWVQKYQNRVPTIYNNFIM